MLTYLEDVDRYDHWNGSTWSSPFGLTLIKKQVIGTAAASVVVNDVFSAAYDTYQILVSGGVGSTNLNIGLQIGASTTGYYAGLPAVSYSSGGFVGARDNNGSAFSFAGYGNTNATLMRVTLFNPFLASVTGMASDRMVPNTGGEAGYYAGFLNNTTSHTGFTLVLGGPTLTGGAVYVYGFRKN
jgi:hypothetical protein